MKKAALLRPRTLFLASILIVIIIILAEVQQVLTIPRAALGEHQGGQQYVVRVLGHKGTIEQRPIKIGISDGINVQVISGLREGEKVLLGGNMALPE